ncbi:CHRD domain-containing protein [Undibacterium sp. TJN19]|uniref:CHRD domain-containing protein n=1 Tax=Undibacterium sp. TJN19 TaxID=3413055 RepID=UPI003BF4459D
MLKQFSQKQAGKLRAGLLTAAIALTFSASAVAQTGVSSVSLSGDAETPAVTTLARGTGSVSVTEDKKISGTINTTGLVATVAHIHMGAEGVKGPPIINLVKTPDGSWIVPGGAVLTDEQYEAYKAGNLYINVHTAQNMDGEIRGQLKP